MSKQFRDVCFTSFNLDEKTLNSNLKLPVVIKSVKYIIYQWEIAPDTGREHAQGYIEFHDKVTMKFIKESVLGDRSVHLENRRGTQAQAIAYCKKVETRKPNSEPFEFGHPKQQGERVDLTKVSELIKEGKSIGHIAINCTETFIKYDRGIKAAINILQKPVNVKKRVVQLNIGPTRSGKTEYVRRKALKEGKSLYEKPKGQWWDGYNGEEVVLFDEMVPGKWEIDEVLQWLDNCSMQVPTKGGFVWLQATEVYITSNYDPIEWFPKANQATLDAFCKRITSYWNWFHPDDLKPVELLDYIKYLDTNSLLPTESPKLKLNLTAKTTDFEHLLYQREKEKLLLSMIKIFDQMIKLDDSHEEVINARALTEEEQDEINRRYYN